MELLVVNRGFWRTIVFFVLGMVSGKHMLLDDLYGQGYWVLTAGARRDLLNAGSNVSGGGMRAEL